MTWVFAYGSNMHLADLRRWLSSRPAPTGRILGAESAHVEGYRLVLNYYSPRRGGGAANVRAEPLRRLPGVALQMDEAGLSALDAKEGHPRRYTRTATRILLASGSDVDAWIYVVRPEHIAENPVFPTRHYRGLLIEAAVEFSLPSTHVDELRRLETCD